MREPCRTASGLTVLTRMPADAALLGEAAREVQLGRLGRRVGGRVLAGDERVLGGDEDDRAAACPGARSTRERLARDEEVAGAEDRVVALPLGERRLLDRRARGDAGVRDDDVDAAERARPPRRTPRATDSSEVTSPATASAAVAEVRDRVGRAVVVEVERRRRTRPRDASDSTTARPMPPAAPVTSATLPCSSPGGGASESL